MVRRGRSLGVFSLTLNKRIPGAVLANKKKKRRKHVPQRTCVGCRSIQDKFSLVRIVRTPDGVCIDESGKMAGRGAYVHNRRTCWELGLDGRIAQALKTSLSEGNLAELRMYLESLPEEDER
jgi:predicted RNA-binding protein YlxR (DUF448 family)